MRDAARSGFKYPMHDARACAYKYETLARRECTTHYINRLFANATAELCAAPPPVAMVSFFKRTLFSRTAANQPPTHKSEAGSKGKFPAPAFANMLRIGMPLTI